MPWDTQEDGHVLVPESVPFGEGYVSKGYREYSRFKGEDVG